MSYQKSVHQADMQKISAMFDGELSDKEFNIMLKRMEYEPLLKKVWQDYTTLHSSIHHHDQSLLQTDLSHRLANLIGPNAQASHTHGLDENQLITPTPVISFPQGKRTDAQPTNSGHVPSQTLASTTHCANVSGKSHQSTHNATTGKKSAKKKDFNKKSWQQHFWAHISVAACVASITVVVQQQWMGSLDSTSPSVAVSEPLPTADNAKTTQVKLPQADSVKNTNTATNTLAVNDSAHDSAVDNPSSKLPTMQVSSKLQEESITNTDTIPTQTVGGLKLNDTASKAIKVIPASNVQTMEPSNDSMEDDSAYNFKLTPLHAADEYPTFQSYGWQSDVDLGLDQIAMEQ